MRRILHWILGRVPIIGARLFPPPTNVSNKKKEKMKIPKKKPSSDQTEIVPRWAWGALAALAVLGLLIWFQVPLLGHRQRQYIGWGTVLSLIGWVWKFGKSSAGLLISCVVVIYTLFGGPLHMASQLGNENMIRILADAGMDLNAQGLLGGATPLHLASHQGRFGCVYTLLSKGADVNATIRSGETALHEAAWEGHPDIVALLLDSNADKNALDSFGQTALHRAAWRGMIVIVKILIDAGARIDIKDFEGVTAKDLTPYDQVRNLFQ